MTLSAWTGHLYGYGSRSSSLGGATGASGVKALAAFSNPAILGRPEDERVQIATSFIYMSPSFTNIDNVVVENEFTSTTTSTGSVDTSYPETIGQVLGASFDLLPESYRLTLGLVTYNPVNDFAALDSGEAFVPEYVLYRAVTQRPQFHLGLGMPWGKFRFGMSLRMSFAVQSNAKLNLQTTAGKASTMRFSSRLSPRVTPIIGLGYEPNSDWQFGCVFRFPASYDNEIQIDANAEAIAGSAFPAMLNASSSLFYDPMTLELSTGWKHSENAQLSFAIHYEAWRLYKSPALSIANDDSGIVIEPSANPSFDFRDIIVPRIGEEVQIKNVTLRAGYSYRPSIIRGVPNGSGNFLDPHKHMFVLGAGWRLNGLLGYSAPWDLDFHLGYHVLEGQTIAKTDGNEGGDPSDSKIGSPGYEAGGQVFGGGISLRLLF